MTAKPNNKEIYMTQPIWQQIHHFWFHECTADDWFGKAPAFDQLIWERFGHWCTAAARGECYSWRQDIRGRVAEIVVLDQFSRNVWRDTPRAFSQDGMALVLAQEAVHHPHYPQLSQDEQRFVLMPYMHSESKQIHEVAEIGRAHVELQSRGHLVCRLLLEKKKH